MFPMTKKMNVLIRLVKTVNALLASLLQGDNVGMKMKSFTVNEQEEEQELFNPLLKKFRNQLSAMTPHPTLGRFHKVFVLHYPKLLLFRHSFMAARTRGPLPTSTVTYVISQTRTFILLNISH